jgi:hypothetical protein
VLLKDNLGLILDNNGDAGDSCNRTGIYYGFSKDADNKLNYFVNYNGICVRHPIQSPWNNPKNFSRDQLIPLIYGLSKDKSKRKIIKSILWATAKRLFFCQNTERDYPGTIKYPWPHKMAGGDVKDNGKWRMFDFADPIAPDTILHMIICGRIYWLYPFYLIGLPWFILTLVAHCKLYGGDDEGQMISLCAAHGKWALRLYRKWRIDYRDRLWQYWTVRRDQQELYELLYSAVKNA